MPPGKRKYDAVTPTKPRSASVSSHGSYRSRPETESEEDELDASPQIISKKPKLFSTPSKSRKKPAPSNSQLDEIDFYPHPASPEPTPIKTPRTKGAKTPKTVKRAATGIVVVSRSQGAEDAEPRATTSTPSKPQRRTTSPSKSAARAFDIDATPRADASRASNLFSQLAGEPVISLSGSSQVSPLKPAVPGAARGRKKAPSRQLLREDGTVSSASHSSTGQDVTYSGSASAGGHSSAANSDAEAPIPSPSFSKPKGGTPRRPLGLPRKLHTSPNKRTLANGDVYVDYMVPMGGADETRHPGLSSGDEGAYISSSADDSEVPLSRPKSRKSPKRGLFGPGDSYSLSSREPPSASRSSSVSRAPSALNYTTSSPYTSRGPSPSPSFPRSQANTSDSESDSDKSIYDHQHHVDPVRHLDKLASLARLALTSAEDMRKKGVMREGEPPLPKCFLTGVVVERGKSRVNKAPDSPSKKDRARPPETESEAEGGEEAIIIRALPERRLGEVAESLPRSRSWMDTVLSGPAGPTQQNLSRQTSSSSIATDMDNPFDNTQTPFRRTNSQSSISGMGPKRPDLAKGLPTTHSEPALETVLAAYDMTPSRTRTIPMTPSKSRLMATPSRTRLFGTPSRAARMKELDEEQEEPPTGQEFNAWFSKQQSSVLRALRDPPWATIIGEQGPGDPQSAVGNATEIRVEEEENETEAVTKLRTLLRRTVETGEGNSCLLVGPRGSGKTRSVVRAIRTLNRVTGQSRSSTPPPSSPTKRGGKTKLGLGRAPQAAAPIGPIVIHLSGHAQTNDRLAMREIARQLVIQSGEALDVPPDDTDQETEDPDGGPSSVHVPTATHLPQIVGALARQVRPVIVVLDAFDLFAEHARQALLYCLLDTVQSCRAGQGSQGLAVVGVTSRIDCITMLEKRVKSRFSHRIIRVSPPTSLDSYVSLVVSTMATPIRMEKIRLLATPKKHKKQTGSSAQQDSWRSSWKDAIDRVVVDRQFRQVLEDIFDLSRDVRLLLRILSGAIASLTPASPWLSVGTIARSIQSQCAPLPFTFLQELAYPAVTLLIATQHIHDKGHDTFTFKMLCDEIKRELGNEAVTKALVQMQGRGLGLMRVPEPVLETAFERLVTHKVVVLAGAASSSTGRAYVKYRCVPDRSDIKEAVERLGHSALKRWFVQGASS